MSKCGKTSLYIFLHCSDTGNDSVGDKYVCTFILSVLDFFFARAD